jgi:hypothetical protein
MIWASRFAGAACLRFAPHLLARSRRAIRGSLRSYLMRLRAFGTARSAPPLLSLSLKRIKFKILALRI